MTPPAAWLRENNSRSALPRKRVAVIKELALVPGRIDGGAQRSTPRLANAFRAG